jgi:hypothetical protein
MLNLDKIKSFDILSKDEQMEALALIDKWKNIKARTKCRDDFLEFVKMMWQGFIMGRHHKILADKFNRIAHHQDILNQSLHRHSFLHG